MASNTENKTDKTIQQRVQKTFDNIYYGNVSDLECPYCLSRPLRFSYTLVKPDRYRIWISCISCKQEAHLRLSGRPPGFDEKYVLQEFQKRDEEILRDLDEWWDEVTEEE